jgi:uncharacterized repeat protein (TIGR01451 family)
MKYEIPQFQGTTSVPPTVAWGTQFLKKAGFSKGKSIGMSAILAAALMLKQNAPAQIVSWSDWRVLPQISTTVPTAQRLAAATYRDRIHLFASVTGGTSTDNGVYWATFNGGHWSSWQKINGLVTDAAVSATVFGDPDKLYVFAKEAGSGPIKYKTLIYNPMGVPVWSIWLPVGDHLSDHAPAAATFDGRLYVFATGPAGDPTMYFSSYDGSWAATWTSLGPETTAAAPTSATLPGVGPGSAGNRLLLFIVNTLGQVSYKYLTPGPTGDWSAWSPACQLPLDPLHNLDLTAQTVGGATAFNNQFMYVFVNVHNMLDPTLGENGIWSHFVATTAGGTPSDSTSWSGGTAQGTTMYALAATCFHGDFYLFGNLLDDGTSPGGLCYRVGWDRPPFALVDINPDSEGNLDIGMPSVAVFRDITKNDPQIIATFLGAENPHWRYRSSDGGRSWARLDAWGGSGSYDHSTVRWSSSGVAYATVIDGQLGVEVQELSLGDTMFSHLCCSRFSSQPPFGSCTPPFPCNPIPAPPRYPTTRPHEVWLEVLHRPSDVTPPPPAYQSDSIYVAFEDNSHSRLPNDPDRPFVPGDGRTAFINFSLDGGATWNAFPGMPSQPPVGIEKTPAGLPLLKDGPGVRVAAARTGGKVYALFARYKSQVTPGARESDITGDVVVVRDDNEGLSGFTALGDLGSLVSDSDIVLPGNRASDHFAIESSYAIAVNPHRPDQIYIAYPYVDGAGNRRLNVKASTTSGQTFSLVWSSPVGHDTVLPALAVADNGTVGLLYTIFSGDSMETHFLQAAIPSMFWASEGVPLEGDTLAVTPAVLNSASSADRCSLTRNVSYNIGRYHDLVASGDVFFGVFGASSEPEPIHFPRGVRYLRKVLYPTGAEPVQNSILFAPGKLVNDAGQCINPSIDPFFFYQYAQRPLLNPQADPAHLPGYMRLSWHQELGMFPLLRPCLLEYTPSLGTNASWSLLNVPVTETNGDFTAAVPATAGSAFFRLRQQPPDSNALFNVHGIASDNGEINPSGTILRPANGSLRFTAIPNTNYALGAWYVDGALAQTRGNTFSLGNIQDDHTVVAAFSPLNDLGLTMVAVPPAISPANQRPYASVGSNLVYVLTVVNAGLNPATGVVVSDPLPQGVSFVAATSSQGSCTQANNTVTCQLGNLPSGAIATVTITVVPTVTGVLTNSAVIAGNELDANPINDQSQAVIPVGIVSLSAAGSIWQYLDDGSDQGAVWHQQNYDDSNWKHGVAKLGYGVGDEATVIGYGPNPTNRHVTTYFRASFRVYSPADYGSLLLGLRRADGAIVYLNGTEVFRSNMPTGAVNYLSLAASPSVGVDETNFFTTSVDPGLLVSGDNLLAVEVHLSSAASDHLGFDLDLSGYLGAQPPTILSQPQSQTVTNGATASFSVQASGTPPLTYQWFHDNAPIAAATATTYTIANVSAADAGIYAVQVSNAAGSAYSAGATLTVLP